MDEISIIALGTLNDTPNVVKNSGNVSQTLIQHANSGAFVLKFGGMTSAPLAYNATVAQVQAALDSLIGAGKVTVKALGGGTMNVPGSVTVSADANGYNWAFSVAAGITRDSKKTPSAGSGSSSSSSSSKSSGMPRAHWLETILVKLGLAGKNLPASSGGSSSSSQGMQQAKNSCAFGGDISIIVSVDQVKAMIRDVNSLTAKLVSVTANNSTGYLYRGWFGSDCHQWNQQFRRYCRICQLQLDRRHYPARLLKM